MRHMIGENSKPCSLPETFQDRRRASDASGVRLRDSGPMMKAQDPARMNVATGKSN
jgi:hypothetical protein